MAKKETTNIKPLKTDRQPLVTDLNIYSNEAQIQSEIYTLQAEIMPLVNATMKVLANEGISKKHAIALLQGNYSDVVAEHSERENIKLEAAKALLGDGLIMEIAGDKIKRDAVALVDRLKAQIRVIEWQKHQHLEYFVFEDDTWKVQNDYQKSIELKNSIILTDPLEIERYQKHKLLIDLINELSNGEMPMHVYDKLFRWSDKQFRVNIKNYDINNIAPMHY